MKRGVFCRNRERGTWKRLMGLFLLFLLFPAVRCAGQESEAEKKKLTVMVYLCGSNLESIYGSATADLMEMGASGFDSQEMNLLVMAGGSQKWQIGLDAEENAVLQIEGGRNRIVHHEPAMNMGERETLKRFLVFCREKYPAEEYALILWNHGAGPLDGVCLDELFSMDSLTLNELTGALADAGFPKKLKWIGFDACLMGDAEVAEAVSPYANWMIASQETEPAGGWDYSFLAGAEEDEDGAATGRRIIDAYFESNAGSRDLLTMACIDLGAMDRLAAELDLFFSGIEKQLDSSDFDRISKIRLAAESYGIGVRGIGDSGYDLVDLKDLLTRYGEDASAPLEALEDAVVYVRSSEVDAGGLSVYHPYVNKEQFLQSWSENYRSLSFCEGYQEYVRSFGAYLTGTRRVEWAELQTVEEAADADGTHHFSLQLTEEQAKNLAGAELMILERIRADRTDTFSLSPVYTAKAELEEGQLTASYGNRALYVTDAEGNVVDGPISFLLAEDGASYRVLTVYHDYSTAKSQNNSVTVLYDLAISEDGTELLPVRRYVFDPATQRYTDRIPFREDGMTEMEFHLFIRDMPADQKEIPGFDEWEWYRGYLARLIRLPLDWRLLFSDNWQGQELYAMFQITDTQQNIWSSIPIRLENRQEKKVSVSPMSIENQELRIQTEVILNESTLRPSVKIQMRTENLSGHEVDIRGSELVLNGVRRTAQNPYFQTIAAGESGQCTMTLSPEDILGLDRLSAVDLELEYSVKSNGLTADVRVPVHLQIENCGLENIAGRMPEALAEAETDGIRCRLLALKENDLGEFEGTLWIQNNTDEALNSSAMMLINRVRIGEIGIELDQGQECIRSFRLANGAAVSRFSLHISDRNALSLLSVGRAVETAGYRNAETLDLHLGLSDISGSAGDKTIHMALSDPVPLGEPENSDGISAPLLEGAVSVQVERVIAADDGLGMGLRIRNDGDRPVWLRMMKAAVNGGPEQDFDIPAEIMLPARSQAAKCLSVRLQEMTDQGMSLESLRFLFEIGNDRSTYAEMHFPEGTAFGAPGGTTLTGKEMRVVPAVWENRPKAFSEELILPGAGFTPVTLKAPLTEEEAAAAESVSAWIGMFLTEEEGATDPEISRRAHIHLTGSTMELNGDREWTAVLSGLAFRIGDVYLSILEDQTGPSEWRMTPDRFYLYQEEKNIEPRQKNAWLFFDPDVVFQLEGDFRIQAQNGKADVTENTLRLRPEMDIMDNRTNCDLMEIREAAFVQRVYHGTDRMQNLADSDYDRVIVLRPDQTLTPELVPADQVGRELCAYYVVQYQDGSRDDIMAEYPGGRILERTHTAPADQP